MGCNYHPLRSSLSISVYANHGRNKDVNFSFTTVCNSTVNKSVNTFHHCINVLVQTNLFTATLEAAI